MNCKNMFIRAADDKNFVNKPATKKKQTNSLNNFAYVWKEKQMNRNFKGKKEQ